MAYELQIIPYDNEVNSIIGGPHESFELMAQQVGGTNFLFSQLMQTLDNYKSFGPPSVGKTLMSQEDEQFKKEHKEWELGEVSEDLFDGTNVSEVLEHPEESCKEEVDAKNDVCSDCGVDLLMKNMCLSAMSILKRKVPKF